MALAWQLSGQYYETCSCDFVCPCLPAGLMAEPTKGSCTFAMAYAIDKGSYGSVPLDGLGFVVLGVTPEEMGKGNWSVGLLADERATEEQREALTAIASGSAGGPMAALAGLIGTFLGVQPAAIHFDRRGEKWSVKAGGFLEMAAEGARGLNPDAPGPMHLDNTGHPANDRFALARASMSRLDALGVAWRDDSGRNNGQYAPFSWRNA